MTSKTHRGASVDKICPIDRFLTDGTTFVTHQNYYCKCFLIQPHDPDGRMPGELATISMRLTDFLKTISTDVILYQYYISIEGFPLTTSTDSAVAKRRVEFLRETAGFKSIAIIWCLAVKFVKSPAQTIAALKVAATTLQNAIPCVSMDEHDTGSFFSYLMVLDPELVSRRLVSRQRVSQQIATQPIRWSKQGLQIGDQQVRQFCLSKRPIGTRPDLWSAFRKLPGNIILCSEYRREGLAKTRKRAASIESYNGVFKRKFSSVVVHATQKKDPEATASTKAADKTTDDLAKLLIELGDGTTYGHYSLMGLIHGRNPEELDNLLPQIQEVLSNPACAGMMVEDPIGQHDAYQAMLLQPAHNVRRRWYRDSHVANLAFAYLPSIGHVHSKDLDAEYLVCYQTLERQPFFYDAYTNQLRGLLISGSPRQGKSFNGNFLIDQEVKYGGFITVYDIGGAYCYTVLSHGGIVTKIGLDGPRFAPFSLDPTRENIHAIWLLIKALLKQGGCILEPRDEDDLRERIKAVYLLPRDCRQLRYLFLRKEHQQYLAKWVTDRVYGHVFDNLHDELPLAKLQVFDFEGVGEHEDLMGPILTWLTGRKVTQRSDPRYLHLPKHDLFDELWKQIRDPQLWEFLLGGLKTGGKRMGGVTMLTHHIDDLGEHSALIKNACPHQMFLPTLNLDRKAYREFFDLNDAQLDEIAALPPRHLCLKTPDTWKRLVLNLDAISVAKYSSSPRDIQLREILTKQYGHEEAIRRIASGEAA
jgi:type IV secretion system protein VirB4